MRLYTPLTLAILLMATFACQQASAKTVVVPQAYMFGFAASFNDSTVYFTDIQQVDSVWMDDKHNFLLGRSQYASQMKTYFAEQLQQPHRTCVVVCAKSRKDIEKKFLKMKRQYTEKKAGKFDVRTLTESDFRFQAVNMSYETGEKTAKTQKAKDKKKGKPRPPRNPDK